MRILSLKLENFQGVTDKLFEFENGSNYSIFGDNATGKTTVYNAFTWLLTGNSSTGIKSFSPKTVAAHGLNHSVEAVILNDSTNEKIVLKRNFHEVYKKKRGSVTETFSGHATDYYINDVPQKEKDFNETVVDLFGSPEQIKALTMPFYFSESMKWDDRRKILIDICGDVSDEDVFESNKDLSDLRLVLENRTVDDMRSILAARRTKLNKDMESIPVRIDEANKSIPETEGDPLELKESIREREQEIEALKLKKVEIQKRSINTELSTKIAEKNAEIEKARTVYLRNQNEELTNYRSKISNVENCIRDGERKRFEYETKVNAIKSEIERMTRNRNELAEEFKKTSEMVWDEGNEICPTCGQKLPAERIEELREQFNLDKSNKLERIRELGKKNSKDLISEKEKELEDAEGQLNEILTYVMTMKVQLDQEKKGAPAEISFETTKIYSELKKGLDALNDGNLVDVDEKMQEELDEIRSHIEKEESVISEEKEMLSRFDLAEKQKARVAELEEELKGLAKDYEETEKELYLCELFTKCKVSLLDEKINQRFKHVRFKLFDEQINGGIKDNCEVLIPCGEKLIPFAYANNASRINAGLEIISTLSDAWNISIPVFVDNAESVSHLDKCEMMQVIRLVVSEKDKELRLVKEA